MSSAFSKMLDTSKQQEQPQRLLFMLAQSETDNSDNQEESGGTISPLMCVDKLPEEIESFATFVDEADSVNKAWNMIFIAAMSGQDGQAPTTEEAEPVLNMMVNDLMSGQDLSRYLILDRKEQQIEIS